MAKAIMEITRDSFKCSLLIDMNIEMALKNSPKAKR